MTPWIQQLVPYGIGMAITPVNLKSPATSPKPNKHIELSVTNDVQQTFHVPLSARTVVHINTISNVFWSAEWAL